MPRAREIKIVDVPAGEAPRHIREAWVGLAYTAFDAEWTGAHLRSESMMPPRFLIQALGGLALSSCDSDTPVLVNQRKRLAFVAALAADANGGIARERLFALFWPESDGERARNALNQMVFAVRRELGDDTISGDAVRIRLNPAVIGSDVRVSRRRCVGRPSA